MDTACGQGKTGGGGIDCQHFQGGEGVLVSFQVRLAVAAILTERVIGVMLSLPVAEGPEVAEQGGSTS